jgi:hypothetical protein
MNGARLWALVTLFLGGLGGDDHAGDFGVGCGGNNALGFELGLIGVGAASDDFAGVGVTDSGERLELIG